MILDADRIAKNIRDASPTVRLGCRRSSAGTVRKSVARSLCRRLQSPPRSTVGPRTLGGGSEGYAQSPGLAPRDSGGISRGPGAGPPSSSSVSAGLLRVSAFWRAHRPAFGPTAASVEAEAFRGPGIAQFRPWSAWPPQCTALLIESDGMSSGSRGPPARPARSCGSRSRCRAQPTPTGPSANSKDDVLRVMPRQRWPPQT